MSKIKKVVARQVYDSRGNPTIEAEVFSNNLSASAICPSGASTGTFEAYEKRDKSNKKYLGKSVLIPVATVNKLISKIPVLGDILIGKEVGEGVFGVSFKMKGPPGKIKTTVNPIKTLTPRFITRALEKRKKEKEK